MITELKEDEHIYQTLLSVICNKICHEQ